MCKKEYVTSIFGKNLFKLLKPKLVLVSIPIVFTLPRFLNAVPLPAATKSSMDTWYPENSKSIKEIFPLMPISLFQLFSAFKSNPPLSTFSPKFKILSAPLEGGVKPRCTPPNKLKPLISPIKPMPGSITEVVLSKYVEPARRSTRSCSKSSNLTPGLMLKFLRSIDSVMNPLNAIVS